MKKAKANGPAIDSKELIEALEEIFATKKIDIIIHSAAVGDYAGKYAIRAEELVDEIWEKVQNAKSKEEITKEMLMGIFENPETVCNNTTKISSYDNGFPAAKRNSSISEVWSIFTFFSLINLYLSPQIQCGNLQ